MKKRLVSLIIASLVISTATPAFAAETTEATVIADTQDSEDEEAVSEDTATEQSTDTDEATAEDTDSDSIFTDDENSDDDDYDDEDYDDESDDEDSDTEDSDSDEDKSICPKSEDGQHEWTDKLDTNDDEVGLMLLEKWTMTRDCTKDRYVRICKLCKQTEYFGGEHRLKHYSEIEQASPYSRGYSLSYDYCYVCMTGEHFNEKKTTIYSPSTITLSKSKYAYSGKSHKPSVTVKDEKGKTISSDNYTVKYSSGCAKVGKYSVKITFNNKKYMGTIKTTFSIVPGKTSLSKLTSTKNSITAKWKKKTSQVTGYQIQYSTNKDFSSTKTISVSKNSSTKKISKLKQGTTYYVRVRTYKKTNGKKYYSSWSAAKSKKTQGKKVLVPGKVKMTSVKADSAIQVTLSWTKASNATFYRIYYKKDNATKWTKLTDRSGDQTSFVLYDDSTATGPFFGTLEAEHSYTFTVRAYNRSSKKWGEYDTKGLTVTLPPYTQLTETEDTVTVNGVTFDMDDFPEKAILDDDNNMEVLSVAPMSTIDPADITYTINNENAQVVSTPDDADHHYMAEVNEYEYYVSGWKNAIAYIDTYYDAEMYMQYRVEVYNALQTGSFPVSVYYKGTLIRTCQVNVTTTDSRIVKARKWIDKIEQNAWTDDMTDGWDKLIAVKDYIYNNYTYNECTCLGGAEALLWAARDLGYEARYRYVGEKYDYSKGYGDSYYFFPQGLNSHICTIVTMEGKDIIWETQGRK